MAQGYGIGMSSRPLDLASGGLSFYQSAVQARRQEIKDHMVEASENEKMMLKAMDMKGLGEVAGKSRDRLDQEIQKFRSEMVEKYRKNQGKLSNADRTWLEGKSVDIQNNITATKNQLQALEKAKLMVTPDKWASYNDHVALGKQLAQAEDAIAAGDLTVNPLNIVMQGFRTPTAAEMISARYKDPLSKIDRSKITTVKGRTATINDAATEESLNQLYGMIAKDPQVAQQFIMRDEKGNPVVDANGQTIMDKELALNTILPMIQDKTEIRPATRAEMGIYGSGGGDSMASNLPLVDMDFGGKQFNLAKIDTPKTMTGLPSDGINLLTGAKVPAGGTSQATFIGPGTDKETGEPVLLFTMKNPGISAPVTIGGKPAYKGEGDAWKEADPVVVSEIEKNPKEFFLKEKDPESTSPDGRKYESYEWDVKSSKAGVEITAYGLVPKGKNKFWSEKIVSPDPAIREKAGSIVLKPAKSTDAVESVSVPLTPETIGYFSKSIGKKKINGMSADQYLQQVMSNRGTNTIKPSTTVSKSVKSIFGNK